MSTYVINGGKKLSGTISVKGAKNLILKLLPATILSSEIAEFENVPEIEDVQRMIEIMKSLGVQVEKIEDGKYRVNPEAITCQEISQSMANKVRTSIMFAGPILARCGHVTVSHPGGDVIGKRPIDLFIEGFKKFGAEVTESDLAYTLKAQKLSGAEIVMPLVSVTATEAMMMTATIIEGTTTIINAAMEPEIVALAEYLNINGAKISGAGSPVITIVGVKKLSNSKFKVMPDRIEAGTLVMMGLITGSHITVSDCEPKHLTTLLHLLTSAGARLKIGGDYIETLPSSLQATDMRTHEYPGIATDLQSPYTVLMTQAKGHCLIHETIFNGRLLYTDILNQMGAEIILCDPHRVVVNGPTQLVGRNISSPDIRAGIGLVLAGLVANGTTRIDNIYQINRGYENIVERLTALGADITQEN